MTTSILRTTLLLALSLIAILALFAAAGHLLAAPVSFAAGYLAGRLYATWSKTDPIISAYHRWCIRSY